MQTKTWYAFLLSTPFLVLAAAESSVPSFRRLASPEAVELCPTGLVDCHGHCVGPNVHCHDGEDNTFAPDSNLNKIEMEDANTCGEGLANCHGHCVSVHVHCEGVEVLCEDGLFNCHGHCVGPNVHCEEVPEEKPAAEETSQITPTQGFIVLGFAVGVAALVLFSVGMKKLRKKKEEPKVSKEDSEVQPAQKVVPEVKPQEAPKPVVQLPPTATVPSESQDTSKLPSIPQAPEEFIGKEREEVKIDESADASKPADENDKGNIAKSFVQEEYDVNNSAILQNAFPPAPQEAGNDFGVFDPDEFNAVNEDTSAKRATIVGASALEGAEDNQQCSHCQAPYSCYGAGKCTCQQPQGCGFFPV